MTGRNQSPPGAGGSGSGKPPRLVDDPDAAANGSAAWAVGLLRSAEPYQSPPGRKQRVRLSLGQVPRRHAPLLLRPAVVLGVLVGCGAIASAALGDLRGYLRRAYEQIAGVDDAPVVAAPSGHGRTRPRPRHAPEPEPALELPGGAAAPELAPEPEPAPTPAPPAASQPAPAPAPTDAIARALATPMAEPAPRARTAAPRAIFRREHGSHAAPARHEPPSPPPTARRARNTSAGDDTTPVLEAMRALRVERDPARARALLAEYLERHPRGTLAEEALAMSIEAAVAHHDTDAAALAARYLKLYPAGPFRALARRTATAAP